MAEEPPQYVRWSSHRGAMSLSSESGRRTPASRSRTPSDHLYHLTNSKGRPWLTLKVTSNAPASNYLPAFFEGEPIAGSVTLYREKDDAIKSISVQIIGQMTASVTEVLNFVKINTRTLIGEYTWPFTLTLPKECEIKSANGPAQTFALPGSFSERMARVHIQYQLVSTIHRKRFRVDSTLGTVIGYCPIIRPDAPSMLRQIAYLENAPLPGPDEDPEGWKALDSLHIRGSIFSTRTVDARCTLALAKPLCYTRGNVIPCVMTIEATDSQALDLLSAPRSPVVRLLRSMATPEAMLDGKNIPTLDFETDVQVVSTAVWRPDNTRASQRRILHGEIHLPATLKPTCRLGKFQLAYSVAVYPPNAVAFQSDDSGDAIMQQETVVIGTVYARGPRPRVYSPPGYDDASSMGQSSEFRIFR